MELASDEYTPPSGGMNKYLRAVLEYTPVGVSDCEGGTCEFYQSHAY